MQRMDRGAQTPCLRHSVDAEDQAVSLLICRRCILFELSSIRHQHESRIDCSMAFLGLTTGHERIHLQRKGQVESHGLDVAAMVSSLFPTDRVFQLNQLFFEKAPSRRPASYVG